MLRTTKNDLPATSLTIHSIPDAKQDTLVADPDQYNLSMILVVPNSSVLEVSDTSVACNFSRRFTRFLIAMHSQHLDNYKTTADMDCDIPIELLPPPSSGFERHHSLTRLLHRHRPNIVLSCLDSTSSDILLSSSWQFPVVQIPCEFLGLTNWINQLTSLEMKRKFPGLCYLEVLKYRRLDWRQPRIELAVITHDRPESLLRLLNSLGNALYFGDRVDIIINIEQTADAQTLEMVQDFQWLHGNAHLRHRVVLGGLLPAVVESWYPADNDTYGVLLEDDVEVSPMFYAWLKMTILRYRLVCYVLDYFPAN
jgi:hypothetical protein